jgi:hypothetical protein
VILERGNMWDVFHDTDVFMITTNPIIRNDGAVVMGRGIAFEAKSKYPDLPYTFGTRLKEQGNKFVDLIGDYDGTPIWYFMVKNHWNENADLGIIASSLFALKKQFKAQTNRIDLNFPGIGNGKLNRDSVLYLLEDLPDNIHIWEYT